MRLLFVVLGIVALAEPAVAWSPLVHQKVTAKAIDTLPSALKKYYKAHRAEMPTLAVEAVPPAEGPERRFAVDRLLTFPFSGLPRTEAGLRDRFGVELTGQVGRLPWLIQESYDRLVLAFKGGDKSAILTESDTIAGLVTELSNPLALSENYDGQKVDQHGFWLRFTVRLPEAVDKRLHLNADAARFLDQPREYVFSTILGTYVWLDNLLYADELAKRAKSTYGEAYYESLFERAGSILKTRLSQAATDAGSYWYTAWTAAGRPNLLP